MTDKRDKKFDELLDGALAAYTPASPRPGFEERLWARLEAAVQAPVRRVWLMRPWLLASGMAFAFAVLAVALFRPHPAITLPKVADNHRHSPLTETTPSTAHHPAAPHLHSARQASHHGVTARRSPARPSQEELIARLMANGPEAIASLAREAEQQSKPIETKPLPDDPLVIDPIRTPPIDNNSAQAGGAR